MKIIDKTKRRRGEIEAQIECMRRVHHKNVVEFVDAVEEGASYYVFFEL